jgi:hypothetical protein
MGNKIVVRNQKLLSPDSHKGDIPLHAEPPTDDAAPVVAEARLLGTLCNREGTSEQRTELAHTLDHYVFLEPEHQVVFESIRSLLPHDRISTTRLAVQLNNRGFPDVDLETYCAAAFTDIEEALRLARRLCSLEHASGTHVHYDRQRKVERDA